MTNAAIYARISQDTLGLGLGIDRQEADCRKLAASKGWPVARVFIDNDVSAFDRRKKRLGYEAMMVELQAQRFDAVVVYNIDRLYRQPRELEDLIDLCEDGNLDFATCSGDIDLGTPDGLFMARMMVNVANKSSADASRRIKRKAIETAQSGRPNGGRRPYGFQADHITHDEHEADVIREATRSLLEGNSLRGVCRQLSDRGDFGANGRPWQAMTMGRMLLSSRLIGRREHKQTGLHDAVWKPIITELQQIQLRAILTRRGERVGAPARYLLSGLLRCGVCGSRMQHRPAWRRNKPIYLCPGQPRGYNCVSITADKADAFVADAIIAHAGDDSLFIEPERDIDGVDLAASIAADDQMIADLGVAYATGTIPLAALQSATSVIDARKRDSERALASRVTPSTIVSARDRELEAMAMAGATFKNWFESFEVDEQRYMIGQKVVRIDVARAPRGAPVGDRLHIIWR